MYKILTIFLFFSLSFADELKFDNSVLRGELENGLKYYIKSNTLPKNTAYFELIINSGSTDERDDELGLAHFVEHMAFNGSRDFAKNDLIKKLESLGVAFGADLNAYTSYDETVYTLKINVNDENLNDTFRVFANWIDGISFDSAELEKERGVIIAEERSRNTPNYRLFMQQNSQNFNGSIYENRQPIGDMNIIKNVSVDKIREFYRRVYQPRFMSFVAVGDFDSLKIEALLRANFANAKNTNNYVHPNKNIDLRNTLKIYNYNSREVGSNSIHLSYEQKFQPIKTKAEFKKMWIDMFISNLINLANERKNGLIRVGLLNSNLQNQKMIFSFNANVVNDDINASLSEILGIVESVAKFGFNKSDFIDSKKQFQTIVNTQFSRANSKKSQDIIDEISQAIKSDEILLESKDYRDLSLEILDKISLDEVNARFNEILSIPSQSVSVFSPNGKTLIQGDYYEIVSKIEPFDTSLDTKILPKSLIQGDLAAGKIISKSYDKANEIYTLIFENNSTAILKPLKTKPNFITFAAVSGGGSSTENDVKATRFGFELANESGVGEFSNYELAKILSDKDVSYNRRLNPLTHGIYGTSSTADLDSLLQAVRLEFISARFDEKILSQIKTKSIDRIKKSQNIGEMQFKNDMLRFMFNNNKRTNPLEISDVDGLKLDDLTRIVKRKFQNAANFKFILVGDFDLNDAELLLAKYIATLPSDGVVSESYADDGVRTINGVARFERSLQSSKRSDVMIRIKNYDVKFSHEDRVKISLLSAVLAQSLREQIREEQGQTYGFGVNMDLKKVPYTSSEAMISFTASPQSIDKIKAEIYEIISRIKSIGVPSHYLQNYKKTAILSVKQSLNQPNFWLENILRMAIFDEKIFDLAWYDKILNSLTNDDIITAARLYLSDENIIVTINNPKE